MRCETDGRAEKIGNKIRTARLEKIPYLLIAGTKEAAGGSVSVRGREMGDPGNMSPDKLLELLRREGI